MGLPRVSSGLSREPFHWGDDPENPGLLGKIPYVSEPFPSLGALWAQTGELQVGGFATTWI